MLMLSLSITTKCNREKESGWKRGRERERECSLSIEGLNGCCNVLDFNLRDGNGGVNTAHNWVTICQHLSGVVRHFTLPDGRKYKTNTHTMTPVTPRIALSSDSAHHFHGLIKEGHHSCSQDMEDAQGRLGARKMSLWLACSTLPSNCLTFPQNMCVS